MHDDTFLINMSHPSCAFCIWHPENIGWFMCISLSRFTTGVSISLGNVCVCVCMCMYGNIHCVCVCWGGGDVCLKICMLSIFPIDLSIARALIYPQHTLIRLFQICGNERSGLGFGFYLLRLANCDFQRFGVFEECCWLCVHKSDCLQTSSLLSEHPASDLFYVSSFCCRVLSVKITK